MTEGSGGTLSVQKGPLSYLGGAASTQQSPDAKKAAIALHEDILHPINGTSHLAECRA